MIRLGILTTLGIGLTQPIAAQSNAPAVPTAGAASSAFVEPPVQPGPAGEFRITGLPKIGAPEIASFLADGRTRFEAGGSLDRDEAGRHTGTFYVGLRETGVDQPATSCRGEGFPVHTAAVTPDGRRAVFSMLDWEKHGAHFLRVGDLAGADAGKSWPLHRREGWCRSIAVTHDGKLAATSYDGPTIDLWDLDAKQRLRSLDAGMPVGRLAFDRAGKRLIAGGAGTGNVDLQVWDLAGDTKKTLKGSSSGVSALEVSSDGLFVASADADGAVWLWLASDSTGRWRRQLPVGETAGRLAFSRDGQWLLVSSDSAAPAPSNNPTAGRVVTLRVFDVTTGRPMARFVHPGRPVRAAAFYPDGNAILTDHGDGVRLWTLPDLATLAEASGDIAPTTAATRPAGGQLAVFEISKFSKSGTAWAVAFSTDAKRANADSSTWDIATKASVSHFSAEGSVMVLRPDADLAVDVDYRSETGFVSLHSMSTGKKVLQIVDPNLPQVEAVALSPDGTRLAIVAGASSSGIVSKTYSPQLSLWDVKTGNLIWRNEADAEAVRCLAFTSDGRQLLAGAGHYQEGKPIGCEVRRIDAATGTPAGTFVGSKRALNAVVASPDGRHVWGLGGNDPICWDAPTGAVVLDVEPLHTGGPYGDQSPLAISSDGKRLAIGLADSNVYVLDARSGAIVAKFTDHEGTVLGVAFSPDGKRLLSAATDKTMRMWDVDDQRLMTTDQSGMTNE